MRREYETPGSAAEEPQTQIEQLKEENRRLRKQIRSSYTLHQKKLLLLAQLFALFFVLAALSFLVLLFLCPFLESLLDQPETEARQRRGYAGGDNNCCYVHVFTS